MSRESSEPRFKVGCVVCFGQAAERFDPDGYSTGFEPPGLLDPECDTADRGVVKATPHSEGRLFVEWWRRQGADIEPDCNDLDPEIGQLTDMDEGCYAVPLPCEMGLSAYDSHPEPVSRFLSALQEPL